MRYYHFIIVAIAAVICFNINAKEVTITNAEHKNLSDVQISFYNQTRDSIGSAVTGTAGTFNMPTGAEYILLNHPDYANVLMKIGELKRDTIVLKPSKELEEVVVTAGNKQRHLTHDSYKLSLESMQSYPTFYSALNEIPNLTVLSNGGLFYEGHADVLLLLNGVETSAIELKALAKDDVYRIDVYDIPPPRFAGRNISSVIDIITRSSLTGGNVGINVSQAFYPLNGDNSAAFFYNYKRSRFSMIYSNENRHHNKYRYNQSLDYAFEGVEYSKEKRGQDSKHHIDNNTITLGYQNNLSGSYLYSVTLGGSINRDLQNYKQEVSTNRNPIPFLANNIMRTKYNTLWLGNYFEKQLGDTGDKGMIIATLKLQRLFSRFYSEYQEFEDALEPQLPSVDVFSKYKSRMDGLIFELQYSLPQKPWGQLSFSAYDTHKRNKYLDTERNLGQTTNSLGANAYYYGRYRAFNWTITMGVQSNRASSAELNKTYTFWMPSPRVRITFYPIDQFYAQLNYSYTGNTPSIAQMSETDQWLDTKLVYHGNIGLTPYKIHNLWLNFVTNTKYFNGTVFLMYYNSPKRICNYYEKKDDYILETMVNLKKYYSIAAELDVTVKPLGSNVWKIWTRINLENLHGEGETYRWVGHRFQWMINTSVNLKKWNFSAYYQYPGKVAEGQLVMPRAEYWSLDAMYRPIEDLSIGIELSMPFGKSFKESQRTVGTALVHNTYETAIYDDPNMVSLTLSWNINFGKNRNKQSQRFDYYINDNGILKK